MSGDFRKRVLTPALIPLGAFAFIGFLVYPVSRILLAVTKEGSVVVATVMSAAILFAAAAVAKGGALKSVQRIGLIAFSLLMVGFGIGVEASLGTREIEGHLEKAATITAQNLQFDKRELNLPADKGFILEFINNDPGQQHNVAVYRTKEAATSGEPADTLFKGAVFGGPATREYEIADGIPAGLYYFQCDVHPTMNGNARASTGASPSPTPSQLPPSPTPAETAGGPAAVIRLVAKDILFDKTSMTFPARSKVWVELDNQDPTTQHTWSLYRDAEFRDVIFRGSIIVGPARTRYEFTSPSDGTYYFKCDVHPTMRGTATVTT